MIIKLNDEEIYELDSHKQDVIANQINSDILKKDMKRRLCWLMDHVYEQYLERMKKEWEPKLKERMDAIPTSDEAFVKLVLSQPDYKDKKVLETEIKKEREARKAALAKA